MSISPNVFRTGKRYRLVNHGDTFEFILEAFKGDDDFLLKDIHTLEKYLFSELVRYGKSKDFSLEEME